MLKVMKRLFKILILVIGFNLLAVANKTRPEEMKMDQMVWYAINDAGIKYPDIVFAQAILESDKMTSKLFIKAKNIFGMRFPVRRPTVAIDKFKKGYAIYDSWNSSVEDYLLFQQWIMRNRTFTRDQYFNYLDKMYCETGGYSKKLKRVLNDYKNILSQYTLDYIEYKQDSISNL